MHGLQAGEVTHRRNNALFSHAFVRFHVLDMVFAACESFEHDFMANKRRSAVMAPISSWELQWTLWLRTWFEVPGKLHFSVLGCWLELVPRAEFALA